MQSEITFAQLLDQVEAVYNDNRELLSVQLSIAYDECVKRSAQFAGPSEMTVKLKFEPKNDRLLVGAEVKTKLPAPAALPINAWVDRTGNLCLEDPRQTTLSFPTDLKEVKE